MMEPLCYATAAQLVLVKLVDSTDGQTPETGIVAPTITICKAGGAFGAPHDGTWAELAYGLYTVRLDATDTDTKGSIALHVEKAGCRNFDDRGLVLGLNAYNALFDLDYLQVDVLQIGGSAAPAQIQSLADAALVALNLDHLMKVPVADITDLTPEVVNLTVLSALLTVAGTTATFDTTAASLEALAATTTPTQIQAAANAALVANDLDHTLQDLQQRLEADIVIVTTTTPWEVHYKEKGTATVLFKKQLKDTTGANITATGAVVGQHIHIP
jgi:hypothetical protein